MWKWTQFLLVSKEKLSIKQSEWVMLTLSELITSASTCTLVLGPQPYFPQQTFLMLLCDKYFSCAQLLTIGYSPLTCFSQNTHSWVYDTWSASLPLNTWCVSILTRRPKTLNGFETITLNDNQDQQSHLSSLFPDVVLPCNLLQSRSWQAQGNSHNNKTTRQHYLRLGRILPRLLVWWTDVSSPPWRQQRSPWALSWASMSSTSTTSPWTTTPWSPPRCGCFWILVRFRSLKLTMRWGKRSSERKAKCVCRVTPERPCPCRFCAAGSSPWGRTTEPWRTTTGDTPSTCHSACLWWSQ